MLLRGSEPVVTLLLAVFVVGEPVPPAIATPELLMQRVQELRGAQK